MSLSSATTLTTTTSAAAHSLRHHRFLVGDDTMTTVNDDDLFNATIIFEADMDKNDMGTSFWDTQLWLAIQILISCTFLLFCCYCTLPTVPQIDEEERRRRLARIRGERPEPTDRLHADPEYRDAAIQQSLIVQQVVCVADADGNLTLGDVVEKEEEEEEKTTTTADASIEVDEENQVKVQNLGPAIEYDDDDDDDMMTCNSCAICLESYRVGDIVAWSRYSFLAGQEETEEEEEEANVIKDSNGHDEQVAAALEQHQQQAVQSATSFGDATATTVDTAVPSSCSTNRCLHVFHRDCIVPWLQNKWHDDCPSCRTILIRAPAEDEDSAEAGREGQQHETERQPATSSSSSSLTAFVIVHGLISQAVRHCSAGMRAGNNTNNVGSGGKDDDLPGDGKMQDMERGDREFLRRLSEPYQLHRSLSFGSSMTSTAGRAGQKRRVFSFSFNPLRRHSRRREVEEEEQDDVQQSGTYEDNMNQKKMNEKSKHSYEPLQGGSPSHTATGGSTLRNSLSLRRVVSAGATSSPSRSMNDQRMAMLRECPSTDSDDSRNNTSIDLTLPHMISSDSSLEGEKPSSSLSSALRRTPSSIIRGNRTVSWRDQSETCDDDVEEEEDTIIISSP